MRVFDTISHRDNSPPFGEDCKGRSTLRDCALCYCQNLTGVPKGVIIETGIMNFQLPEDHPLFRERKKREEEEKREALKRAIGGIHGMGDATRELLKLFTKEKAQ